jgi:general secretion pathway protein D
VPNNNTIVLGGLIVGRNGKDKSGIPILSDIPYLGSLFSTTEDTETRSELMVFMQPSIVTSDRSLENVQDDMYGRYKVSPEVQNFADGDSVLPGVNEIPRAVEQKGKGGTFKASAIPSVPSTNAKSVARPAHRR